MPAPISQLLRGQIIAQHNNDMTRIDIARQFHIHVNTVSRIIKKYEEEGHADPAPISGRPNSLNADKVAEIVNLIRDNSFQSSRQIAANLNLNCNVRTIRRYLQRNGYHHHVPAQKEKFTELHKQQRMGFALQHLAWQEEWMCTIFSDEKVFSTDESGRVTLWRTRGTRYVEKNIRFRTQSGRITLAFWGCMTSHGLGPLVQTTPHMNIEEYIHILADVMLPYVAETFPGNPRVFFVQDNSGVHRARIVQDWLAQQPNLTTLNWPAKSPDLNVIENLWAATIQEWDSHVRQTREALAQYVFDKWEGLRARPALFQNLVDSMPQRLNSVIENNGGATRF